MCFSAFLISVSFDLCGSKIKVSSTRSSKCKVFQNDLWSSLLNQPIFIADQKVAILWRPSPLWVFGEKMTSWDTMLAFNFAASFWVVGVCSPLMKFEIIVSIFLQYFFDGSGGQLQRD